MLGRKTRKPDAVPYLVLRVVPDGEPEQAVRAAMHCFVFAWSDCALNSCQGRVRVRPTATLHTLLHVPLYEVEAAWLCNNSLYRQRFMINMNVC